MMTVRPGVVNELCFAAEGMAGTAGASSLRRLSSLAHQAPAGRLFGAISTLSDMSARATQALEQSHDAMASGDDQSAFIKLARAMIHMDDLAGAAQPDARSDEPPAYLQKQR